MKNFHHFNLQDNLVWQNLFARQINNLQNKASSIFFEGVQNLHFNKDFIPDFHKVSMDLSNQTGWKLESTDIPYSSSQAWFEKIKSRTLLVTEFIRDPSNIDYTPSPDIFHDAFGHIPFLANRKFADIAQKFGELYFNVDSEKQRKQIEKLWWFTFEFGLIKENGQNKIFGGGIISSFAESNHVFSNSIKLSSFIPDNVVKAQATPDKLHEELFVLDSFEQLENILETFK